MLDAMARLALVVMWLAILALMFVLSRQERGIRPYFYGLIFTPAVNIIFYIANYLWRLDLVEVPPGFFSDLSVYRTWAVTINILIVLIIATAVSWMKRQYSS